MHYPFNYNIGLGGKIDVYYVVGLGFNLQGSGRCRGFSGWAAQSTGIKTGGYVQVT